MSNQDNQIIDSQIEPPVVAAENKSENEAGDPSPLKLASGVGRRRPVAPAHSAEPARRKVRSGGLGRGGVSALVLLLVFLPIIGILSYLLLDSNNKVESLQYNLKGFQSNANPNAEADFAALLGSPNLQILPFKSEDGSPFGRVILFSAGRLNWGFSYGRLEPLAPNQAYVMWLQQKSTTANVPPYRAFLVLPDVRTGGALRLVQQNEFPSSFRPSAYAALVITVESVTDSVSAPKGPRRFTLDLSEVND